MPEHEQLHIGYNITHDAGLIAMAFEVGTSPSQPWVDPPAHRIGVDVMHLSIPARFTLQSFVETVGDAVRTEPFFRPSSPSLPFFLRYSAIPLRSHPPRLHVFPKPGARNDWLMICVSSFPSRCLFNCPVYHPHTTGIFFVAYAIREGNPEPNATSFFV